VAGPSSNLSNKSNGIRQMMFPQRKDEFKPVGKTA
jgi:hypothetical protein